MERRIAIVGAGISGLLACKHVLEKGFHPIVFEAEDIIGGVWTRTIEFTKLQNPKLTYQFSDFPWPSSVKEMHPGSTQVLEYIESYAQHFGLIPYVKLNSLVTNIEYFGESNAEMQSWDQWSGTGKAFGSKGKWNLTVKNKENCSTEEYIVEFVILCIGRFSCHPNIPELPPGLGPEVYTGKVMHSMEYSAMDNAAAAKLIKGTRIAIVGSGKSAMDLAMECANANGANNPCTVILRTAHWMLPSFNIWGVNYTLLYANRFSEFLVHKPGETFFLSVLATLLSPLRWGISKFVESYLRWKLPLKKCGMIPNHSFLQDASSCLTAILPEGFYEKVAERSIILKRSQSFSFCSEGLVVDGEAETVKADLVILATGYKGDEKLKNVFKSPTFKNYIMGSPSSTIRLYRQIIHPWIPQLAIIGYSESLMNLFTFEIRCRWLAYFLDGAFQLPSIEEMEKDVAMWETYMKQYAGKSYRRSCIAALHIWYNDQLCKDIGFNPRRKKGFFAELFEPYGGMDYVELAPDKNKHVD